MSICVVDLAAMILEYLRFTHICVAVAAKIHEYHYVLLLQLRSTSICVVFAAKIHEYLCCCS